MGKVTDEIVPVSIEEFTSSKYQSSFGSAGNNPRVRIYYNDGKVDPERTYTDKYCREHKLGKYAEKASKKESKKERKQKSDGKGYFGMSQWNPLFWILWVLVLPFRLIWWFVKQLFEN